MGEYQKTALKNRDTYIYIDVSNIRAACLKTLGFRIDFVRLLDYFKRKYPALREVRYYEGIATGDTRRRWMFDYLAERGYTICALERKAYCARELERRDVKCPKCGNQWTASFMREHRALKSNVDVYLATELLTIAHRAKELTQIVLVSCDGDYAEMIKNALRNENVSLSVLATPPVRDFSKNTLSVRLRELSSCVPRYRLHNIGDIKPHIEVENR